ncbi:MAG: hypothetical protein P4L11_10175 [Geothrix sp.]|nr:hypothetical protein [Geothrix sp.]
MNTRGLASTLLGALLAGGGLFAQAPASGRMPPQENRPQRPPVPVAGRSLPPKQAARVEHQDAKASLNVAKTLGKGAGPKQEPAKPHSGQNQARWRIIRPKRDARNIK